MVKFVREWEKAQKLSAGYKDRIDAVALWDLQPQRHRAEKTLRSSLEFRRKSGRPPSRNSDAE